MMCCHGRRLKPEYLGWSHRLLLMTIIIMDEFVGLHCRVLQCRKSYSQYENPAWFAEAAATVLDNAGMVFITVLYR